MKRRLAVALLAVAFLAVNSAAPAAHAAAVRVVRHGPRARVVVRTGFPLHRTLPHVFVRAPLVAVRVTPRVFLPPVVFGAVIVAAATAPAAVAAWQASEAVEHGDDWTELTMNVDQRGSKLLLDITNGAAQVSFAEVVFDNGDTQVVDFNDRVHKLGTYVLLDFKDGRKVDHVRLVAKADSASTRIGLRLLT